MTGVGGGPIHPAVLKTLARLSAIRQARAYEARATAEREAERQKLRAVEVAEAAFRAKVDPELLRWSGFARFAESQLVVADKAKRIVPFRLNLMQRRIVAEEIRARRRGRLPWFLILKYRKLGVSTLEQALAYWETWRHPHQDCMTLAHAPDDTRMLFRITGRFWENHDPDMRHRKTQAIVNHIEFPDWDSIYTAGTAGKTGVKGRGGTYSRLHGSEVAFYKDLGAVHTSLTESVGPESAIVYESTPNGRVGVGRAFYEFWKAARAGRNEFIPLFFPWHSDPDNRLTIHGPDELDELGFDDEAKDLQQRFHLTMEQIAWWLTRRRRLVADSQSSQKIHQEMPSDDDDCFLFGSDGYYDLDILKVRERQCVPPVILEDNGRLRIWELPDPDEPADYLVTADPSEGTGNDDCAAIIWNVTKGKQAASYAYNRIPPDLFGVKLAELGRRWRNLSSDVPAFLMIELNNSGHATLSAVIRQAEYPTDRVYHQTDETKLDETGHPIESKIAGWRHTTTGHADLTTAVGKLLREGTPKVLDAEVIRSVRAVGTGATGAVFTGRDLAVCAGLGVLGWSYAKSPTRWMWIGGQRIEI